MADCGALRMRCPVQETLILRARDSARLTGARALHFGVGSDTRSLPPRRDVTVHQHIVQVGGGSAQTVNGDAPDHDSAHEAAGVASFAFVVVRVHHNDVLQVREHVIGVGDPHDEALGTEARA